MTLQEQLTENMKQAMRDKDMQTLQILRGVLASIKNKALEVQEDLDDAQVMQVIKADVKKLQDALKDFVAASREDLAEKTQAEIAVLKAYLPEEMSPEELERIVREKLAEHGIENVSDMGRAMGVLMGELRDKVDGNRVKKAVQKVLKG